MLGLGLMLFGTHSTWLQWDDNVIFLPWIGVILIILAVNWAIRVETFTFSWRPLWITIPIGAILCSMLMRLALERTMETFAGIAFILAFISVYIMARHYGRKILSPIVWFTAIEALSVFGYVLFVGSWHTDDMTTGGMVSDTNYDVAIGIMGIGLGAGLFVIQSQKRLIAYSSLVIAAMFLTGSPETLVVLGCLMVYVLFYHRHNAWHILGNNRKLISTIGASLFVFIAFWAVIGGMDQTVHRISEMTHNTVDAMAVETFEEAPDYGDGRFPAYERALTTITPFGHGFSLFHYRVDHNGAPVDSMDAPYEGIIAHNVPLVIVEQIGIFGAIAWLVISVYCFIIGSNRMRILWVIIGALCIFDHFIWTTIAPVWWAIVGLTIWEVDNEVRKGKLAHIHSH